METEKWMPLYYGDYDTAYFFEYNLKGDIKTKKTGKISRQKGRSRVLYMDGECLRIDMKKLLPELYADEKANKVGRPKNPTIKELREYLDKNLEQLIKVAVAKELQSRFGSK